MKKLLLLLPVLAILSSCNSSSKQKGLVFFNDFESAKGWVPGFNLCKYPVYSGVFSVKLDSVHAFGPTLKLKFDDISPLPIRKVKFSIRCFLKNLNAQGKFIVAVDSKEKKNILWEAKHIQDQVKKAGQWMELKGEFNLNTNDANNPANTINIYPWNISKEEIYVDDMRVEFVL
jgi:hypothetical protein